MSSLHIKLARVKQRSIKSYLSVLDHITDADRLIRYTYYKNGYHNPEYHIQKNEINFLHLPKTGGTSLCKILEQDSTKRFGKLNIHRPISKHCPPEEYRYVTVMRDPIARVWSYYQMVLRSPKGYPYQKWANKGLEVFLDKCWAARNMSCRYLSGQVELEPNKITLDAAFVNLQKFYAVLDFRNFSEEVSKFLTALNFPQQQIPNERNHTYAPPDDDSKQLIKQYNQLDISLFESWNRSLNKEPFFDQTTEHNEST